MTTFADLTTLRVGGNAPQLVVATSEEDIIEACQSDDLLVIGGGSNLLVSDNGFAGHVLKIATSGQKIESDACSGATVTLAAGEQWSSFVDYAVSHALAGVETLAGIPGLVGAAPIQNIGAYGSDISESIAQVRTYDRKLKTISTFAAADCGFGYRTSRFKSESDRWIVLDVTLQLRSGTESNPIKYQELADVLSVEIGQRAPIEQVREAVLELRKKKGMLLDANDHDTWSAGSFFTNPIVESSVAEKLPTTAPRWPVENGMKISAAWLIEQAGFSKGDRLGGAAISSKHSLALTNASNATADDLIALASKIRNQVHLKFGIWLEPEVRLVGMALEQN